MNLKISMFGVIKAICVAAIFTATAAHASLTTYNGPSNSFVITDSGIISALNVFVNIGTPYADDVTVNLIHNGISALLYQAHGDTYNAVIQANFSDSATSSASYNGSAIGTFTPVQVLSSFINQNVSGTWTLQTQDFIVPGDDAPLLG